MAGLRYVQCFSYDLSGILTQALTRLFHSTRHHLTVATVQLAHPPYLPHLNITPDPRNHDRRRRARASRAPPSRLYPLATATDEPGPDLWPRTLLRPRSTAAPGAQPGVVRQARRVPFLARLPVRRQHRRARLGADPPARRAGGHARRRRAHTRGVAERQGLRGRTRARAGRAGDARATGGAAGAAGGAEAAGAGGAGGGDRACAAEGHGRDDVRGRAEGVPDTGGTCIRGVSAQSTDIRLQIVQEPSSESNSPMDAEAASSPGGNDDAPSSGVSSAATSDAETPGGSSTPTGSVEVATRDRSGTIIARPTWDQQATNVPAAHARTASRSSTIRVRPHPHRLRDRAGGPSNHTAESTDTSRAETETEDDGDDVEMSDT